jgi:Ca2+-binding EF-hand superfamily protein
MWKHAMRNRALIAALQLAPAIALAATTGTNARLAEQFRRADADGNGMVSRAEAERAAPLLAKQFDAIDANRDGQISPEEIRAFRRAGRSERRARGSVQGTQAGTKFEDYFARADTDGDGVLSRAEAERGLPRVAKKFERIDRDGDGRLTREEIQAWLAARRAARVGKAG